MPQTQCVLFSVADTYMRTLPHKYMQEKDYHRFIIMYEAKHITLYTTNRSFSFCPTSTSENPFGLFNIFMNILQLPIPIRKFAF